jgi:hypothetical protein
MKKLISALVGLAITLALSTSALGAPKFPKTPNSPKGLNADAIGELQDAGVDKYLGEFTPVISEDAGDGWTKHTFDRDGGDGPICIAGTPYTAFTRPGDAAKLLIFEQGGGACWQDFTFCNIQADELPPTLGSIAGEGIFDLDNPENPFADHSIVYMSYCDGSVHSGDNDVVDANFRYGPVRFHRGLRNQSAAMDLAKATFPHASKITVAGSSAGGAGVATQAPFLVRMLYGNQTHLTVINDAGPVAVNLIASGDIAAREADWQVGQFYPASCTDCDAFGQSTALIHWRLANDSTVREAFYSTDGDRVDRFFLKVPTQAQYRELILTEHGALNDAYPDRYKRFIVSGDTQHTVLRRPDFYSKTANGVLINEWTDDFISPRKSFWVDIVEEFVPIP